MMRQPTPRAQLYEWHTSAVAALAAARVNPAAMSGRELHALGIPVPNEPQCGFFKRRFVRGGPFVPARIWMDQKIDAVTGELTTDEKLRCQIDGKDVRPEDEWVGLCARPIPESEFRFMCADADWAQEWKPDAPQAQPARQINLLTVDPPTFDKPRKQK